MTGTAATEAEEFRKIYKLEVVAVPTNKDMIRKDMPDMIYKTLRAKYGAVVADIEQLHLKGQPVLVGTTSIEKNEIVADFLKHRKIPHNVLNAKNHEKEASIIAQAGKPGAVTVATNMAGRGVDIILGGAKPTDPKDLPKWEQDHQRVVEAGGLHIIGTERHESRRIDNQLRGRAGRQGDPGSSKFYLSLEDDLMRIFGGEQISSLMTRLNLPEDQPIENGLVSRAIEQAQVKVEGFHFDMRKRLVEFDDVANQQRDIIYKLRNRILEAKDIKDEVLEKLEHEIEKILTVAFTDGKPDYEKVLGNFLDIVPFDDASIKKIREQVEALPTKEEIQEFLSKVIYDIHTTREKQLGAEVMRQIEIYAYLGAIDHLWIDHIDHIDDLREAISLRAYGQRDPLVEFKNEAFTLFENLMERIDEELSHRLFRIQVGAPQSEIPLAQARTNEDTFDSIGTLGNAKAAARAGEPAFRGQAITTKAKIGRNDPCPCGSGKKYKHCHYPQYG
jgi:preprotein translocase subunit SecA